jgi:hypothetical protein
MLILKALSATSTCIVTIRSIIVFVTTVIDLTTCLALIRVTTDRFEWVCALGTRLTFVTLVVDTVWLSQILRLAFVIIQALISAPTVTANLI